MPPADPRSALALQPTARSTDELPLELSTDSSVAAIELHDGISGCSACKKPCGVLVLAELFWSVELICMFRAEPCLSIFKCRFPSRGVQSELEKSFECFVSVAVPSTAGWVSPAGYVSVSSPAS